MEKDCQETFCYMGGDDIHDEMIPPIERSESLSHPLVLDIQMKWIPHPLYRKLHPSKEGEWNLSLISVPDCLGILEGDRVLKLSQEEILKANFDPGISSTFGGTFQFERLLCPLYLEVREMAPSRSETKLKLSCVSGKAKNWVYVPIRDGSLSNGEVKQYTSHHFVHATATGDIVGYVEISLAAQN